MSLIAGTQLGPYEVVNLLGAGGMGEVYRARDTRLRREVAVKVLPASLGADPDALRRFEQEARAAGALNHPNIVAIHDIGHHPSGSPYVVSELLEGETLRERHGRDGACPRARRSTTRSRSRAGWPPRTRSGIVHRDLKPENIFLTRDGAGEDPRLRPGQAGARPSRPRGGRARGGRHSDPPPRPAWCWAPSGYMSPEQVRGAAPSTTARTSSRFGAVLYEMLTGQRAFKGAPRSRP